MRECFKIKMDLINKGKILQKGHEKLEFMIIKILKATFVNRIIITLIGKLMHHIFFLKINKFELVTIVFKQTIKNVISFEIKN